MVIFGSAEIAELAKYYFEQDSKRQVVAFTVDDSYVEQDSFNSLPLVPFSEVMNKFPPEECDMHVALSYTRLNRLRQEKYEQAKAAGYQLASYMQQIDLLAVLIVGDNCLSSRIRPFSQVYI